ncbi:MAG: dihydrodipicolinate synthase family protein [Candidatus Dormibacteraceae bacterium]
MAKAIYRGIFPIVPTAFDDKGVIDEESQLRAAEFLIDAGANGYCILANFSEQLALSDGEREYLTKLLIEHARGRVPVIVTASHFSAKVAADRCRQAQDLGAAMVMLMAPYHGTVHPDEAGVSAFFETVNDAVSIPIMIQDSPVSGVTLSTAFLARLASELENVAYFKIESAGAAVKLRELIRLAGPRIDGPFDGEEGITMLADLDAGATGTMPGGIVVDVLRDVFDRYQSGDRAGAIARYETFLPLISYENKLCGLRATKALLKEAGVIKSEAVRAPTAPLHPAIRAGLIELATRLDPLIMRYGR